MLARFLGVLLGVRLFYKILAANGLILLAALVMDTVLTVHLLHGSPRASATDLAVVLSLVGVVVSVVVNVVILHLALRPLRELEDAASRVSGGDLGARVEETRLADRDLARLIVTFNSMLDGLVRYRERLRRIARRALHAAEAERQRISRELHDDTAQRIAGTMVKLRAVRASPDEAHREVVLNELRAELADTVEHVREVAQGLRPPSMDLLGITSALRTYTRKVTEGADLQLHGEIATFDGRLSEEGSLALYRIIQAALANVVRHSEAHSVTVHVEDAGSWVRAIVEDDGRGFQLERAFASGESLGLLGMEERAAYVGGHVSVRSTPGKGTRVDIEIPVTETASHV